MVKFVTFYFLIFISPGVYAAEAIIPISINHFTFGIVDSLIFIIDYGNEGTALFENMTLHSVDKGKTYHLYSVSGYRQNSAFVSYLTNGQDDTLNFTYQYVGGGILNYTADESDYFSETAGHYSPDIGPHRINGIAITIENLDFDLSVIWIGIVPLFYTDISFKATITVLYNTACIPAMIYLLLLQ